MLLGTLLGLGLVWPAHGQTVPYPATIQTNDAEVRCKPGTEPTVYVTHRLPHGTAVEVVEKLPNGWLKIDPPRGAFSWVNTRALRPAEGVARVWVVAASNGPVPVLVGSPYKPGKPDVVGTNLTRGAQVIAVGEPRPADDGDGSWLPILPPPGEFRYIREVDVSAPAGSTPPVTSTTAAHAGSAPPPMLPGAAGQLPPVGTPTDVLRPQPVPEVHVPPAANVDPLLQQARELESKGDKTGAASLYDQLGKKYWANDHEAAVQYQNRAAWLRGTPAPAAGPLSQTEALYRQALQYEQASNWAEASKAWERLGALCSDNYSYSTWCYNRAAKLRKGSSASPASTSHVISAQKLGPGLLRRSNNWIDGQPTYVLQSPQGQVIAYVTPQAGVNLEGAVERNVEVLGEIVPRADLRDKYMTVARVIPLSAP
jgi:hypothetical protein